MGKRIYAVDLFCGTGGLSLGLQQAGVRVAAGIDIEQRCQYPYETNIKATFVLADINKVDGKRLKQLWPEDDLRLLAGCAPCQPFSSQRRGAKPSADKNWPLLLAFAKLVKSCRPELVTMENVPRLMHDPVFTRFTGVLHDNGYHVTYGILYGPDFGLAQTRRRLILLASRLGEIEMPKPTHTEDQYVTVNDVIGKLRPLENGEADPNDPLHVARRLSDLNLRRAIASKAGGTWRDWPEDLLAECQKKDKGRSFGAFYGRMRANEPGPTITTQPYNTGAGRFTHPTQHRGLSLREAALLQGFPKEFIFTDKGEQITFSGVGKLIGNAVPPAFGKAVGTTFMEHIRRMD